MNSEKVKEIKKALDYCCRECDCDCPFDKNGKPYEECKSLLLFEALTLINELEKCSEKWQKLCANEVGLNKTLRDRISELESENERLKKDNELLRNAKVVYETVDYCYEDLKKAEKRIAELEEALLDMVVQFCQMGKEGYLNHTFMSAEENAFDVLDIEYGEKVDDVYKRFYERWGKDIDKTLKEFIDD